MTWQLWLPGFLLALSSGLLATALLSSEMGWGWAATIAVPVSMGILLGYGVRADAWLGYLFVGSMIAGFLGGLYFAGVVGAVCFWLFGVIAFFPLLLGWVAGVALRNGLKGTRWSQAAHLPILASAVLLPYVIAVIEGPIRAGPATSVTTTIDLAVPADVAFAAWQFFEDVPGDQPKAWILNLSPSLRPATVVGDAQAVGDVQTCYYERGRLSKKIAEIDPVNRRVSFVVTEQVDIESDNLELVGGSMTFEPLPNGGSRAVLVTTYRPKLQPRIAWAPAESYAMRAVHRHVLDAIEREGKESLRGEQ